MRDNTYPLWYRQIRTHRHARDRREFERLSAVRNAEEAAKALEGAQHVYVFAAREYVKVGVTNDPVGRWHQIRGGNPLLEPPFHVTQKKYPYAYKLERAIHEALKAYRVPRTEWFKCNRYLALEIARLIEESWV